MARSFNTTLNINVKTLNLNNAVQQTAALNNQLKQTNNLKVDIQFNVRRYSQTISQLRNVLGLLRAINQAARNNIGLPPVGGRGGGGGRRVSADYGPGGLLAHAVPIQFYNAIQAFRGVIHILNGPIRSAFVSFGTRVAGAVGMGTTTAGVIGGVAGIAGGVATVGAAAAFVGMIASLHSFKIGLSFATNALQTMASMVLQAAVGFTGKVFELIDEQQKTKLLFMNIISGSDMRSQSDLKAQDPAEYARRMGLAESISRKLGMAGMGMGLGQGQTSTLLGQFMPELIQAMNRGAKAGENIMLTKTDEFAANSEKILGFAKILNSFGEKSPKYYMTAMTELFQGKSGSKGVEDLFRSLKMRAGVRPDAKSKQAIAAKFETGDISGGLVLLEKAFNRSGYRLSTIADLLATTLGAKLQYAENLIRSLATPLFDPLHKAFMGIVSKFNTGISSMLMSEGKIQPVLTNYGKMLATTLLDASIGPARGPRDMYLTGFVTPEVMNNPNSGQRKFIDDIMRSIKDLTPVAVNFGLALAQLFKGFFVGGDAAADFKKMGDVLGGIGPKANELGVTLRKFLVKIVEYIPQVIDSTILWSNAIMTLVPYLKTAEEWFLELAQVLPTVLDWISAIISAIKNYTSVGWAAQALGGFAGGAVGSADRGPWAVAGGALSGGARATVDAGRNVANSGVAFTLGQLLAKLATESLMRPMGLLYKSIRPGYGRPNGGGAAPKVSVNPTVKTEHKTQINAKIETNVKDAVAALTAWQVKAISEFEASMNRMNASQNAKLGALIAKAGQIPGANAAQPEQLGPAG